MQLEGCGDDCVQSMMAFFFFLSVCLTFLLSPWQLNCLPVSLEAVKARERKQRRHFN